MTMSSWATPAMLIVCASAYSSASSDGVDVDNPLTDPDTGPAAGNQYPEATCAIPQEAGLDDVSAPTSIVGTGTPESCSSQAFVDAVASGGIITFNCGAEPVTITLEQTAKIVNDTGPEIVIVIVIDGGGLITLSGAGERASERATYPLHEHLRRGTEVHDVPLPKPRPPKAHDSEPDFR